jgi:cytochrome c2
VEHGAQCEICHKAEKDGKHGIYPKVFNKGSMVILDPQFMRSNKKEKNVPCAENSFDNFEQNLWSYFIQE